jgi:hypothetical protein
MLLLATFLSPWTRRVLALFSDIFIASTDRRFSPRGQAPCDRKWAERQDRSGPEGAQDRKTEAAHQAEQGVSFKNVRRDHYTHQGHPNDPADRQMEPGWLGGASMPITICALSAVRTPNTS